MAESLAPALAMLAVTLPAVAWDLRERRIPNALTYSGIAAGLGIGLATGGAAGLAAAALGMAVALAIFALPVLRLGIGMGDLKLAMALGSLGGPAFALWMCLYAMAAGGVVAAAALLRRRSRPGQADPGAALAIPYAVPIAVGVLAALVDPGLPR